MPVSRRVALESISAITSSVLRNVKFSEIPIGDGGYLHRLRAIRFDVRISSAAHAGTANAPIDWNLVLGNVSLECAGDFVGPKNLSGPDLQAIRKFFTGRKLPWLSQNDTATAVGDANEAAGTNEGRRVVFEYRFDAFGAGALDFCPMISYLAKENATLSYQVNLPTNSTALTAEIAVYLELEPTADIIAVAPIVSELISVDKLEGGSIAGGLILGTMFKNAADWAGAGTDLTRVSAEADGRQILKDIEPNTLFLDSGEESADLVAAVNHYCHAMYPDDMPPTNHANRYKPFLCAWHSRDRRFTKKPVCRSISYTLTGSESAANLTFLHTRAKPVTAALCAKSWASSGKLTAEDIESALANNGVKLKSLAKTRMSGDHAAFAPVKYSPR